MRWRRFDLRDLRSDPAAPVYLRDTSLRWDTYWPRDKIKKGGCPPPKKGDIVITSHGRWLMEADKAVLVTPVP